MSAKISRQPEIEQRPQPSFIVIDGSDACGKSTQFDLLHQRLKMNEQTIRLFDFPRYDSESSYLVRRYLKGEYGSLDEIGPRTASLFFAMDRYDAKFDIKQALDQGEIVLANRFSAANLAHQGTKIKDKHERTAFFNWINELEFNILGIPRPTLNIILDVPLEISLKLIEKRNKEKQTSADIHERDIEHQKRSRQIYLDLCRRFPDHFKRLVCVSSRGELLAMEEIGEMVWQSTQAHLWRQAD